MDSKTLTDLCAVRTHACTLQSILHDFDRLPITIVYALYGNTITADYTRLYRVSYAVLCDMRQLCMIIIILCLTVITIIVALRPDRKPTAKAYDRFKNF